MTKQHFNAFAEQARHYRTQAKAQEKDGHEAAANALLQMAQGIEEATITVGRRFNPQFDEARFRAACIPEE